MVLLVDRMEVTMSLLLNITDFIADSDDLSHLQDAMSSVDVSFKE